MKRRLVYILLSAMCIILCVFIVWLFSDMQFIRGFIGDFIIVIFIYSSVMAFKALDPSKVAVFTLVLAFTTELSQYLQLASVLGLQHNKIAQLLIGSVFDPMDLLAYTIGCVAAYIIDTRVINLRKR